MLQCLLRLAIVTVTNEDLGPGRARGRIEEGPGRDFQI